MCGAVGYKPVPEVVRFFQVLQPIRKNKQKQKADLGDSHFLVPFDPIH